jgi:hypothetical protein
MRPRHRQPERRTPTRRRRKMRTAEPIQERRRGRTLAQENESDVWTERESFTRLISAQRSPGSKLFLAFDLDLYVPNRSFPSLAIRLSVQPMDPRDYGLAGIDGRRRRLACWQENCVRMRSKLAELELRAQFMLGLQSSNPDLMTSRREEILPSSGAVRLESKLHILSKDYWHFAAHRTKLYMTTSSCIYMACAV